MCALFFGACVVVLFGFNAALVAALKDLKLACDERGHLDVYSFQSGQYCSYLIRMNSKNFRHADLFFTEPQDEQKIFSYDLPEGNIHVSVQEIACSRELNSSFFHGTSYFPFVNLSRSAIEKKFPCSLKFVFKGHFRVQKVSVKRKYPASQHSCFLDKDDFQILILGDSTTKEILPFLSFKCKELSYQTFESYYPERTNCVFFGQNPAIRVGLKLWLHYGNLRSTLSRYDIVIISAGLHDMAPLHDDRMKIWIRKKFKFSGSASDPYYQLGFGRVPFPEKPHPIQDYFQNLSSLLDILTTIQPSVKYFFVSTPFGRWRKPVKPEGYACRHHPQRIDLIQIINNHTKQLVGSQHFLDMKQLSLTASKVEDDLFIDEIHAKMGVKEGMKRLQSKAEKIETKICELLKI